MQLAMNLAQEKGASSWLTVLPLEEHGFTLHKRAFWDAVSLRYGWAPSQIPTNCACDHPFTIQHVFNTCWMVKGWSQLSCPKGGYPSIRHNELRDLTANLLTEICRGVAIEPTLQPITSERLRGSTANTKDGA